MQSCSTCNTTWPDQDFYRRGRGRHSSCKHCQFDKKHDQQLKEQGYHHDPELWKFIGTMTYEFDFARSVLDFSYERTIEWLTTIYQVDQGSLELWGLHRMRRVAWRPDKVIA